jgi:hypothetical protein
MHGSFGALPTQLGETTHNKGLAGTILVDKYPRLRSDCLGVVEKSVLAKIGVPQWFRI